MSAVMENMALPARLMKVDEVAKAMGVSVSKVYQLMDRGRLAFVKMGDTRCRRIEPAAVRQFVEANRVGQ